MEKIIMRRAYHRNENPPTEKEFWQGNNKQRHELIKRDFSRCIKYTDKNLWIYIFYPETDLCVRFQLDKKKQIIKIETYPCEKGNELRQLSEISIRATNNFN